jgi:dipeptidyl aminopeptidase/acylaminoacyl peptidase
MRCLLLLPLITLFPLAGGCTQQIADKVLIPAQSAERAEWLGEQRRQVGRRLGDRLKPVDFMAADDVRVAALMLLPEQSPRGVIVVLHGLTDRKEAMLGVAENFADAGYITVVPDLRAHGSTGGRYTSMGFHEKRDMVALLDYLQAQGCDVSRVGVLGGSLGGAVSLQWAGIDPRVKAVVAVAPFAELRTEMQFFYKAHGISAWKAFLIETAAQAEGRFSIGNVSPLAAVKSIDTPILLAHGQQDTIVPVTESRRLFAAARGPVALQEVKANHMDIKEALGQPFMKRAVDWMDNYVAAGGPRGTCAPPQWVVELPSRNMPLTALTVAR